MDLWRIAKISKEEPFSMKEKEWPWHCELEMSKTETDFMTNLKIVGMGKAGQSSRMKVDTEK